MCGTYSCPLSYWTAAGKPRNRWTKGVIQQGVSCPSVKHGQLEPFEMTANYLIKSRKTTLLSWYAKLGDAYLSKFSKKDSLRPIRSDLNALFRKILEILMNLSFAKDFLIFQKDNSGP